MLVVNEVKVCWLYYVDAIPYYGIPKPVRRKMSEYESNTVNNTRLRDVTACIIFLGEEQISNQTIIRGWNDKQDNALARKLALQKALRHSGLAKEIRESVWEAYRTSTKVPRWHK